MKIFGKENGKEKVYAQMNDIMFIMHETDIAMPAAIIAKVFKNVVTVNDSNRFDFVEFYDKEVVEFFKQLDWIIDYSVYIKMSDEEIAAEANKVAAEDREIVEKYNSMNEEDRKNNSNLIQEHELKSYKVQFLSQIYGLKHEVIEMPLPECVLNN